MITDLPDTHTQALRWLRKRGGEGVLDRYGALTAQGQRKSTASTQVWLRLFTTGHIQSGGPNRIQISALGKAVLGIDGVPAAPSQFVGARERAPMLDEEQSS